jgi:NADPH-dependent 2,4-dienoyl-CoA reductase/sulfur reductase-like enzyme
VRDFSCEVLVIGAGPAGIAASVAAARAGARVALIDMQAEPGGQIWRGQWRSRQDRQAQRWFAQLETLPILRRFGLRVVDATRDVVTVSGADGMQRIRAERVILTGGARERLLPFPGWTLPGVFGAGGIQALAKNGWPVEGKRIVVAGSGPLLLAVADSLRARGAIVRDIVEQAPRARVVRFAPSLLVRPGKLGQALGLGWRLRRSAYRTGSWVLRAEGIGRVERAIVHTPTGERRIDCDALAVGYGLVPNLELALAYGCELRDGAVWTDPEQRSSVPGIYCAGEATGIGGVDQALAQGEIAGYAAAGQAQLGNAARRRLKSARRFAIAAETQFAPRAELRALATDDTLVCRCEDVSRGALAECRGVRDAKLQTRLGMGQCQGRICGTACQFLFGWEPPTPRPPFAPLPLRHWHSEPFSTSEEESTSA